MKGKKLGVYIIYDLRDCVQVFADKNEGRSDLLFEKW